MELLEIKKLEKNLHKYYCDSCDFKCCQKCDWDRHIMRPKHTNSVAWKSLFPKNLKKTFFCECGKTYKTNAGLWKHKQKCKIDDAVKNSNENIDKDNLIMMLITQNSELIKEQTNIKQMIIEQQNFVLEIAKNGTIYNTTNNTNSHNKSFNLQFFLNETCKNAMNITEFVDSIKLQLNDLEKVGELGYVEGISNIITTNLKQLDITQRPIHCADKKREILYVKDENKWEKEDDNKKIRKAIKKVVSKNQRLLIKFKEAHPDCVKASSHFSDQYNKIIVESMGGSGDNENEKEDKIIKNITKVTTIDKN